MDILQWLINTDNQILLFVNGMHSPYFDYFMKAYSGKWIWIPLYISLFYILLRNLHWKMTLLCLAAIALTITFADQIGASLIRPVVERLRPANLENPISEMVHIVDGYRGGRYGFPSCHAANTFGLAFFIHFLFRIRNLTIFMMGWAILTCYSRMYLGVHYLGDLLAGMLLGLTGAALMFLLFIKVSKLQRNEHYFGTYIPISVGTLSIVAIALYAGFQTV